MKKILFSFLATILSIFVYSQTNNYDVAMQIDPRSLAAEHNRLVQAVHQLQSQNSTLSVEDAIRKVDNNVNNNDVLNKTIDYFTTNTDSDKMLDFVYSNMKTDDGKNIVRKMVEIVKNYGDNYPKLNELINAELSNSKNINEFDLKVIQVIGYTYIASSDYWNNTYPRMNLSSVNSTSRRSVRSIVNNDGAAIGASFIGWAILAVAFPPAAPVAAANMFASVAVGGALGSIIIAK